MSTSPRQILDCHWDGKVPVDVVGIARAMGVQVQPNPSVPVLDTWRPGAGIVIEFNPDEKLVRQRFALAHAHAIGHLALGHLKQGERRKEALGNFSSRVRGEEQEANNFAMALLVPENTLRYAVQNPNMTDANKLAELFGVSPVAMVARISQVRLS